jgi:hypothetical protein
MRRCTSSIRQTLALLAVLLEVLGLRAGASATLLVEEPYGKLGFFTATGHTAVYLSGVCAQTPLILRRCAPGSGPRISCITFPLFLERLESELVLGAN